MKTRDSNENVHTSNTSHCDALALLHRYKLPVEAKRNLGVIETASGDMITPHTDAVWISRSGVYSTRSVQQFQKVTRNIFAA